MRYFIPAFCLALAVTAVQANSLAPTPEPGLWQATTKSIINGNDVLEDILKLQEDIIASQPEEHQAMMRETMMKEAPRTSSFCVSREDAITFTQPTALLYDAESEEFAHCNEPNIASERSKSTFNTSCNHTDNGFVGEISGEKHIISPKKITTTVRGTGVVRFDMSEMGGTGITEEPLESHQTQEFVWVGSDCADTL